MSATLARVRWRSVLVMIGLAGLGLLLIAVAGAAPATAAQGEDSESPDDCAARELALAFVGAAIAVNGSEVEFRPEQVTTGVIEGTATIDYGGDSDHIDVGKRYRVQAWADGAGGFESTIDENCSEWRTTHVDGSTIETGWLSGLSGSVVLTRVVLPLLGVIVALFGIVWLLGRGGWELEDDPS